VIRYYIAIKILGIIHRSGFYLKHEVSENGFCLLLQLNLETSSIYWTQLSRFRLKTEREFRLRNVVFYTKDRTTDNAYNCDSYINIPSS
jgi:hypothetical protein